MKYNYLVALALSVAGCSDVEKADWNSMSTPHRITLYGATGTVIQQWETDGYVRNAGNSDGVEFKSKASGKLVRVSGTVVVETL